MNKMTNNHVLANDNIGKLLWKLSLPAMVGMFVMALYNIVDTIFVGHMVGTNAIAALTVSFPVQMIVMGFGIMNGVGSASLISISLGEGNSEKANHIFHNALLLILFLGFFFTVTIQIFLDKILVLFGAGPDILPISRLYLGIVTWGATFQIAAMTGNNIIRSEGQAKFAMISMTSGAVLNIILDAVFIFIFKMGVRGVAIATLSAQIFQTLFQFTYFNSKKSALNYKISLRELKLPIISNIFRIGVSSFLRNAAGSLMMIIFNNVLRIQGGTLALAAAGVIFRVLHFTFMPIIGIAQGMQPIVGFNFGARRLEKVVSVWKKAAFRATVISVVAFILVMLFPRQIISIFSTDEELLLMAGKAIRIMFAGSIVIGFQVTGATFFQAINKAKPALILSISRQILFLIPLLLLLPRFWGLNGAWIAHPISDAVSAIITGVFLWREIRLLSAERSAGVFK
ncbi:MAG: MATE family efflux transporter [Candidatus Cloacimonetes bacterium]|nr:MATE family efflux transporter [Candidatus Cloacimonadota bacterium]